MAPASIRVNRDQHAANVILKERPRPPHSFYKDSSD